MSQSVIKIHPILGTILYRYSNRAKRLTIKLSPSKGLTLVIPQGVSEKYAEAFLEKHAEMVNLRMAVIVAKNPRTLFDKHTVFSTYSHSIKLIESLKVPSNKLSITIDREFTRILYHPTISWEDDWVQNGIRKAIEETLRKEALAYIPSRVEVLAKQFEFQYNQVSIRNTRSQWGSCSGTNRLSFSLHLMALPDHLIDLVILHELCHTIHKNHSVHFHQALKQVCSQKEAREKELKSKRIGVF